MELRNLMDPDTLFQYHQFAQQAYLGTRGQQHTKEGVLQSQHQNHHIVPLIIQIQPMAPM